MTPPSDFRGLKNFRRKRIAGNRMQNWMRNSCLHLITTEILRLHSPELNPLDHYAWENIRGQLQVSFKTEDIAELK